MAYQDWLIDVRSAGADPSIVDKEWLRGQFVAGTAPTKVADQIFDGSVPTTLKAPASPITYWIMLSVIPASVLCVLVYLFGRPAPPMEVAWGPMNGAYSTGTVRNTSDKIMSGIKVTFRDRDEVSRNAFYAAKNAIVATPAGFALRPGETHTFSINRAPVMGRETCVIETNQGNYQVESPK